MERKCATIPEKNNKGGKGIMTMTDDELLLAISGIMDKKLEVINRRVDDVYLLLENNVLPRLQNIESCYTSTYRRYANGIEQQEAMQADIDVMKRVLMEHSGRIQQLEKA